MRRCFGALVAFVLSMAGLGNAVADEPNGAPVGYWTGFYVGLNAGYTWSANDKVYTNTTNQFGNPALGGGVTGSATAAALATTGTSLNASGFIGGVQAGYGYRFADTYVIGLEADFQGVSQGNNTTTFLGSAPSPNFPANPIYQTLSFSSALNYLGTLRGRFGYTPTPKLLAYGTGGLAYGQATATTNISQQVQNAAALPSFYTSSGSITNTLVGWTAGAGLEWEFAARWSAKAEYLYYDLGGMFYAMSTLQNFSSTGALFSTAGPAASAYFNGHLFRAGVDFHF